MCKCTPNIKTPFCGNPGCEWPEQVREHRLKRVFIDKCQLMNLLLGRVRLVLPEDARIREVREEFSTVPGGIHLLVESKTYEPIHYGAIIPMDPGLYRVAESPKDPWDKLSEEYKDELLTALRSSESKWIHP